MRKTNTDKLASELKEEKVLHEKLTQLLAEKTQLVKVVTDEIQAAEKAIVDLKTAFQKNDSDEEKAMEILEQKKNEKQIFQAKLGQKKSEFKNLSHQFKACKDERMQLEQRNAQLEIELDQLNPKLEKVKQETQLLEIELNKLQESFEYLQEELFDVCQLGYLEEAQRLYREIGHLMTSDEQKIRLLSAAVSSLEMDMVHFIDGQLGQDSLWRKNNATFQSLLPVGLSMIDQNKPSTKIFAIIHEWYMRISENPMLQAIYNREYSHSFAQDLRKIDHGINLHGTLNTPVNIAKIAISQPIKQRMQQFPDLIEKKKAAMTAFINERCQSAAASKHTQTTRSNPNIFSSYRKSHRATAKSSSAPPPTQATKMPTWYGKS